jgi:hypothetical protein
MPDKPQHEVWRYFAGRMPGSWDLNTRNLNYLSGATLDSQSISRIINDIAQSPTKNFLLAGGE